MEHAELQAWIGRREDMEDTACAGAVRRLAALLDHTVPPWKAGEAPPLAHWLYFLPTAPQSRMDVDGHPVRGELLPPTPLPRRMWAGGRLQFMRPVPLGSPLTRTSEVVAVQRKTGASGEMIFVTVRHEIRCGGEPLVTEEQDIVYRAASRSGATAVRPAASEPPAVASHVRSHRADEVQLFRFSALTFNAHRIHYDRAYATKVEGYPGLVVHGPFLATLLMDHFLRAKPEARLTGFSFRAQAPVFDGEPFELNLAPSEGGGALWVQDVRGAIAMRAEVQAA